MAKEKSAAISPKGNLEGIFSGLGSIGKEMYRDVREGGGGG